MSKDKQLTDIQGIGESTATVLVQHGFNTVRAVAEATPDSLSTVPGFQTARAEVIQKAAEELLRQSETEEAESIEVWTDSKDKKEKKKKDKKKKKNKGKDKKKKNKKKKKK